MRHKENELYNHIELKESYVKYINKENSFDFKIISQGIIGLNDMIFMILRKNQSQAEKYCKNHMKKEEFSKIILEKNLFNVKCLSSQGEYLSIERNSLISYIENNYSLLFIPYLKYYVMNISTFISRSSDFISKKLSFFEVFRKKKEIYENPDFESRIIKEKLNLNSQIKIMKTVGFNRKFSFKHRSNGNSLCSLSKPNDDTEKEVSNQNKISLKKKVNYKDYNDYKSMKKKNILPDNSVSFTESNSNSNFNFNLSNKKMTNKLLTSKPKPKHKSISINFSSTSSKINFKLNQEEQEVDYQDYQYYQLIKPQKQIKKTFNNQNLKHNLLIKSKKNNIKPKSKSMNVNLIDIFKKEEDEKKNNINQIMLNNIINININNDDDSNTILRRLKLNNLNYFLNYKIELHNLYKKSNIFNLETFKK